MNGASDGDDASQESRAPRGSSGSADSLTLPGRSSSGSLRLGSTDTGHPAGKARRHGTRDVGVSFSPDGRWLATTGDDEPVNLRDCATREPLEGPLVDDSRIAAARFVAGGTRLDTQGTGGHALWSVEFLGEDAAAADLVASVRSLTGHRLGPQDEVELVPPGD